jgi:hypothetical protein
MVLGIFLESIASDQNNEPKKFVWLSTSLHLIHCKSVKPEEHEPSHARSLCSLEMQRSQSKAKERLVQDIFSL